MKNQKLTTTNLAIFVLFFGVALLEAFQKRSWLEAILFLGLGILSLSVDIKKS